MVSSYCSLITVSDWRLQFSAYFTALVRKLPNCNNYTLDLDIQANKLWEMKSGWVSLFIQYCYLHVRENHFYNNIFNVWKRFSFLLTPLRQGAYIYIIKYHSWSPKIQVSSFAWQHILFHLDLCPHQCAATGWHCTWGFPTGLRGWWREKQRRRWGRGNVPSWLGVLLIRDVKQWRKQHVWAFLYHIASSQWTLRLHANLTNYTSFQGFIIVFILFRKL